MEKYAFNWGGTAMRPPRKLLLIMKLTTFILMITLAQVSAKGFGQKISLSENNTPIEKVLQTITRQSGYNFIYSDKDLKDKRVNIDIKDASVEQVMEQIIAGLNLQYKLIKKNIAITRQEEKPLLDRIIDRFRAMEVSGTIVDSKGQPLSGATVRLKSTGRGVSTDIKGNFRLYNVEAHEVIVVSFLGYRSRETPAKEDLGVIQLEVADSKLDEVQVVAYTKTSLRQSTGNITAITASDIEKSLVSNPILALQGRVPGMTIVQASGNANSAISVLIQGKSSLLNQTDPFYVVDGVPYPSQMVDRFALPSANAGGSPLTFINPDDIESISILKDADATAIYGSRAANGAVLIQTKKGEAGALKVTFNARQGIGQVERRLDLMNTEEYLAMRLEAKKNDNLGIGAGDYDLNGSWDKSRYTDWQKELIGGNANYGDYSIGFSGGTGQATYLFSSAYKRSTTVFPGSLADKSIMNHFSLNTHSLDQRFQVQLKVDYAYNLNTLPLGNLTTNAVTLAPNAPALYNLDGTLNWALNPSGVATWRNPLSLLLQTYKGESKNLGANALVSYQLTKDLQFRNSFGYNDLQSNSVRKIPLEYYPPNQRSSRVSEATFSDTEISSWIAEPQLNYKKATDFGLFSVLAGSSIQQQMTSGRSVFAANFLSAATMDDPSSAATSVAGGTTDLPYKYLGVFANLNYDLKSRYLVNLSARRDGSSRFGEKNKFHNFGAVGLGWVFSEENWMKAAAPVLSFAKMRASYGTTGNDQLPDYAYLSLFNTLSTDINYGNASSLQALTLGNPYVQWEETRKLNLGLDLGFLHNRILLNVNYYRNRSSNMLIPFSLPTFVGFPSVSSNFAATVQNTGLEFSLSSENIKSDHFRWSTNLNFTLPRNRLVRYDDLENSGDRYLYKVGEPITLTKVYEYAGVNQQTGRFQFRTASGTLTPTPDALNDRTILVNTGQRFNGGVENNFIYRGFQLSFLFQFVRQNGINLGNGPVPGSNGLFNTNAIRDVLSRWQSPTQTGEFQRYVSNGTLNQSSNSYYGSDAVIRDASYIKLKNLSLSWRVADRWKNKLRARDLRLYAEGQNLLTITHYKGLDPEALSSTTLPTLRVMTLGLQASF